MSLATLAIAGPHLRAHQLERILERCPPQGRRCPGPAVTPDRMATSERSPRVGIDVELGATVGSPAGSIEVLQASGTSSARRPRDDRLAARRQPTHYEGAHTEYEAVMQSIFRAVGSDRPARRSSPDTQFVDSHQGRRPPVSDVVAMNGRDATCNYF